MILQTYEPDHYGIRLAASQDFRAFYLRESAYRRGALYPPFTVIARIVFTAKEEEAAQNAAKAAEKELDEFLDRGGHRPDIVQMRALECPVKRLRGEYRYQVFLKMYFKADTRQITARMQALAEAAEGARAEDVYKRQECDTSRIFLSLTTAPFIKPCNVAKTVLSATDSGRHRP